MEGNACACMYLLTIATPPNTARSLQSACRGPLNMSSDWRHDALQDTGDTRETPAIDVCHGLIADDACLCIYDPQVSKDQIYRFAPGSRMTSILHSIWQSDC